MVQMLPVERTQTEGESMSYMDNSAFDNSIQELSFDEIDGVNGGIIQIYIAYYSIGIAATLLAAGAAFVAGAQLGYSANRD